MAEFVVVEGPGPEWQGCVEGSGAVNMELELCEGKGLSLIHI